MSDKQRAEEYHRERSKRSRIADESFRAVTVTDDYERWRQNPDEIDFEGVDTIPPSRKRQRAESALQTAQDVGLVNEFVEAESTRELPGTSRTGERGAFQGATKELGVKTTIGEGERQETLAHEVGHSVDYGDYPLSAAGFMDTGLANDIEDDVTPQIASERMTGEIQGPLDEPNPAAQELRDVSQEARWDFDEGEDEYRDSPEELFADFMGSAIIRPRNTKAKTKEARKSLADTFNEPVEEFGPSKEFIEKELSDDFLPGL